ncbi:discoidin domain-containing protein [Streptomyces sp. NBC_01693]|uniref:discoidin domain-containing protein n=1 Tax=unclassified Streptomyces TaxID=2593676 RepID=UPI000F551C62|nr:MULTISPECIES: discoidin domain-containing protein [unclassified Streptomyces]WSS64411.1 discoidin domain-containing protein [Streptomyces sp. NBC_01177]WSS71405.1 discoidin domain-containing protein [Streptomyces sp. NBC_01175]WSS78415.1 discoidin domain-containing protein [Streptomyces sp. NBC_01174]MDX3431168.1 discoidin domain-containing protein [Streptomyces sp. ME01-18a]MDX3683182.1 discoidin domain-containing protein [Streptomyces sp. AK04-4c]
MPSRTTLLVTATAALAALTAPMALAAPAPGPAARAAAAAWDTDRAAAAYTANPGAVTASGSENGASGPGAVADGDAATRWSSDFADDAWIRIDLGSTIRINQVKLEWEAAYGKRYVLEVSRDGTNWTDFYTEDAGTGGTVTAHTYPQEVTGRYVRMRGVERGTAWGYSLFSFQVYGGEPAPASATRANLALNHPAFGNLYQHAGNSPAYITDGGWPADLKADRSRWSSDWNADRWVGVDLGATSTISSLDLYWEAAYAVDYEIQVSDDNRTWRTVHRPSAGEVAARRADVKSPADAVGRHDTITLSTPATGRYVRMLGKERRSFHNPAPSTAQFGYSLYEFQVWGTGGSADAAYPALPKNPGGAYRTTFFDDFTGSGLDRSKWRVVRTGTEMGPVNGESQAYVDSPDTIRTENGALVLESKYCKGCTPTPDGTFDFTSGRVDTNTKFDFTYGKVSARMKLPVGDGFWPAFWMLGSDVDDPAVSWPGSGETDIMENIGYGDWTSSALHGPGYSADGNIGASQTYPSGGRADQWHTYGVEWTPEGMTFTVDDRVVQRTSRQKLESTRGKWVFDHNQYVILNLALGGAYPAGWNQVTQPYWGLPQSSVDRVAQGGVKAEIDWVRVEQK